MSTIRTAVVTILLGVACEAAQANLMIGVTNFTPDGNATPQTYSATASVGTLDTITASTALPVNTDSTVGSTTYSFSLSNLTIDSISGFTLHWELVMAAGDSGTGSDPVGLLVNGVANRTWVVDGKLADATFVRGVKEIDRVNDGESIAINLQKVSLTGGSGLVSSAAITGAEFVNQVGTSISQTGSGTTTYSVTAGANTIFRLDNIGVTFDVAASPPTSVPEPPTAALALLPLAGLLSARLRRRPTR